MIIAVKQLKAKFLAPGLVHSKRSNGAVDLIMSLTVELGLRSL